MTCPNCKRKMKKHNTLSTAAGKEVFVWFVVGQDVQNGKTYCEECIKEK